MTNAVKACAGTGQDGDKLKGVAWPNPRFTDNLISGVSDGTVTDNLTGLIWLKNASCLGTPNWADALIMSNSLASGACGLSDGSTIGQWRLPSITEMASLVDLSNFSPALTTNHPFIGVPLSGFWSSTTYSIKYSATDTPQAWYVNIDLGYLAVYPKNLYGYVWPVRGGL
jgi:hypothetical protein